MTYPTHAIASITARDNTADLARSALPDAPTVADREGRAAAGSPVGRIRQRTSLILRRLADRLDAPPAGRTHLPGAAS